MGCPTHHWIYGENIHSEKLPTYSKAWQGQWWGRGYLEVDGQANQLENCLKVILGALSPLSPLSVASSPLPNHTHRCPLPPMPLLLLLSSLIFVSLIFFLHLSQHCQFCFFLVRSLFRGANMGQFQQNQAFPLHHQESKKFLNPYLGQQGVGYQRGSQAKGPNICLRPAGLLTTY